MNGSVRLFRPAFYRVTWVGWLMMTLSLNPLSWTLATIRLWPMRCLLIGEMWNLCLRLACGRFDRSSDTSCLALWMMLETESFRLASCTLCVLLTNMLFLEVGVSTRSISDCLLSPLILGRLLSVGPGVSNCLVLNRLSWKETSGSILITESVPVNKFSRLELNRTTGLEVRIFS
jgi:hypothetical protein